jgi:hypothetical protein
LKGDNCLRSWKSSVTFIWYEFSCLLGTANWWLHPSHAKPWATSGQPKIRSEWQEREWLMCHWLVSPGSRRGDIPSLILGWE